VRLRGPGIPIDPDPEFLRLPDLGPTADEGELLDYADELCDEPCTRDVTHLAFLDRDGRQVAPAGRLHGVPRLPRRAEVDDLVDMFRHQGARVRARQLVCVWQTADDELADRVGVDAWASGLLRPFGAGPLTLRALWHRSPNGFVVPGVLEGRTGRTARDYRRPGAASPRHH